MSAVKIMCGCAAVMALAGEVAGMPPDKRTALWASLGVVAGSPSVARPAAPVPTRITAAAASPMAGSGTSAVTIPPDRFGQFQTIVEIEGQRLSALVDTGASFVCLTFEDAERLGIRPLPADFKYVSKTANGQVGYARTELNELRLDRITVQHVTAFVAPRGALSQMLVGMNFLSRLRGFRVEAGQLVLDP